MNIKGIEYEVKSKIRIGILEDFQDDPSVKNQIALIQDVLIPKPSHEDIREMDTEDFELILMEFSETLKDKNTDYKKKLSI